MDNKIKEDALLLQSLKEHDCEAYNKIKNLIKCTNTMNSLREKNN